FSVPAIVGTAYFLFSLLAGQLGADLDVDADIGDAGHGHSPGAEFRTLSLQTLSAFFMGSGWMGLGALRLLDFGYTGAAIVAIVSGVGVAWLLTTTMRSLMKLQSSGNIAIDAAQGCAGSVYIAVPPAGEGSGRVTVVLEGRQREFDAVQRGGEAIASRTPVKVVGVDAETNTITVEPQ
ncbi:MAG: hypothetical protein ACF8QF_07595, partial [Phycisphaerales bacterium]